MKQYFILSIVLVGFLANSIAQSGNTLLHLDKSFYVTGEVVWYKFYLPSELKGQKKIVEVLVSDKTGDIIEQYFLQSEGNSFVEGYYKIPFNIEAGWYRISILPTGDSKALLSSVTFPVYNDLSPMQDIQVAATLPTDPSTSGQLNDLSIEVQLNKATYAPRDQVQATLMVKDQNGKAVKNANLSVSVSDANLITQNLLVKGAVTTDIGNEITVEGTLIDENSEAMRASVLGMYSSLEDRIFYSSADNKGRFAFTPPIFSGKRPIQFVGYQFEHMEVGIQMDERKMLPIERPLTYTEAVKDYMALSRQRKKIFQIYKSLENQIEPEKVKLDVQDLNPGFTYVIDEYESFDFMYSFFGELITPLKFFLQPDSTYKATLYNPTGRASANTQLSGDPLFIIDGKLTRDADFVARMDMDYIERVELMYKSENLREKFSAIGRSGVVKMTTNLKDVPMAEKDAEDIFTISGVQSKAAFPTFQANDIPSSQPFFRPQLYWNANIVTDANGKANFTFYQSDDLSQFIIRVVGQGENGGFGKTKKKYEVKIGN
ncbi:MAG: hypothetical protein AAGG68_00185 [Bacteroidota bacterium]